MTNPTLGILNAVDRIIEHARTLNRDIPDKIVVVMDSGRRKNGMAHGHFASLVWHDGYSEIKLGTESLSRGAVPTLGTILHELSHAIAFELGIRDTSNKGRYHNAKFRGIALDAGISLENTPTLGWSTTTVPDGTVAIYKPFVEELEKAIVTYREGYSKLEVKKTTQKRPTTKMECGCGDPVSVNKGWFERVGQFAECTNCNENFRLVENV